MKDYSLAPIPYALSNGQSVALFPDASLEYVKIDFTFDAGTVRQAKPLVATTTNALIPEGTLHRSAEEIAEFLDFRGIILDKNPDTFGASLSVYMLRKYADETLSLLYEMLTEPAFAQREFDVVLAKKRSKLMANLQKTRYVARNCFYETIFGKEHPLGRWACEEDFSHITLDDTKAFFRNHYLLSQADIVISGGYDEALLKRFDEVFGRAPKRLSTQAPLRLSAQAPKCLSVHHPMPGTVQSTIRVGSLLPWAWDSMDYARFMILNTVLGGYFGSRLMSNIREDKGYTYGIFSQTLLQRGGILFWLSAEVGSEVTQPALAEVYKELDRLCQEPVSEEELERVKHYMEGDFLRSIDGIFERSERYRQMRLNGFTEQFTTNYFEALRSTTPQDLLPLAQQVFPRERLVEVVVGA